MKCFDYFSLWFPEFLFHVHVLLWRNDSICDTDSTGRELPTCFPSCQTCTQKGLEISFHSALLLVQQPVAKRCCLTHSALQMDAYACNPIPPPTHTIARELQPSTLPHGSICSSPNKHRNPPLSQLRNPPPTPTLDIDSQL